MEEKQVLTIPLSVKLAFAIITVLFFVTLLGFSWVVNDVRRISEENTRLVENTRLLTKENKARISEIQQSRTESCKTTYLGIREVFRPFFPPPPRTKEQQENLDKFNEKINDLTKGCTEQTKPDVS